MEKQWERYFRQREGRSKVRRAEVHQIRVPSAKGGGRGDGTRIVRAGEGAGGEPAGGGLWTILLSSSAFSLRGGELFRAYWDMNGSLEECSGGIWRMDQGKKCQ